MTLKRGGKAWGLVQQELELEELPEVLWLVLLLGMLHADKVEKGYYINLWVSNNNPMDVTKTFKNQFCPVFSFVFIFYTLLEEKRKTLKLFIHFYKKKYTQTIIPGCCHAAD